MNANLTTLQVSFEVEETVQIMCGIDKKNIDFPQKVQISNTVPLDTKNSLSIVPNVFCPNSETSHFYKNFQKIVFFKKFLSMSTRHFWQAYRNHFRQNYIGLSLKVRKGHEKSGFCTINLSSQFVLLDTWMSVLKELPKVFSEKSYKIFAQSPRIKTKNRFFIRKSPKMIFWTRRLRSSSLPEFIQPNWKI